MFRELTRLAIVDRVLRVDAILTTVQPARGTDARLPVTGWSDADCLQLGAVVDNPATRVVVTTLLDNESVLEVVDDEAIVELFLPTTASDAELDSVPCTPLSNRYDSWPLGDATRLNLSERGACDGADARLLLLSVLVVIVVVVVVVGPETELSVFLVGTESTGLAEFFPGA